MTKKPDSKALESPSGSRGMLRFRAQELHQAEMVMYAFVAEASCLRRICTVSRREKDPQLGYQRHLQEARLRQVARYVDAKGVIPNNIILDFYEDCVAFDTSTSELVVPQRTCAWVIDGQHRLYGFAHANVDYPLLVLGFLRLPQETAVEIFKTINTQQKRLPTSLVLDLLAIIGTEDDIKKRCRDLVARLNEEEDSPWYGRIDMTGEAKYDRFISLVNFTRKLRPHIEGSGVLGAFSLEEQYGSIRNYWTAIRMVFTDQWATPKSLLTKTLGFGALMNVFPTVFQRTLQREASFEVTKVVDTLRTIEGLKFDSHTLGSGSGNKAEMAAAKHIKEELERTFGSATLSGTLKL